MEERRFAYESKVAKREAEEDVNRSILPNWNQLPAVADEKLSFCL